MVAELFLQESRPIAVTIATIVNWLANSVVGLAFPYILVSLQCTHFNLHPSHLHGDLFWISRSSSIPMAQLYSLWVVLCYGHTCSSTCRRPRGGALMTSLWSSGKELDRETTSNRVVISGDRCITSAFPGEIFKHHTILTFELLNIVRKPNKHHLIIHNGYNYYTFPVQYRIHASTVCSCDQHCSRSTSINYCIEQQVGLS